MSVSAPSPDAFARENRLTLPRLATVIGAAVVLYVAQDVFLPIAFAMLIAFALSPLVVRARRLGLGHLTSVLATSALAFLAIGVFGLVVFSQLANLALNLPTFQSNIALKLESLQAAGSDSSLLSNAMQMLSTVSTKIGAAVGAPEGQQPMPVEVIQPTNALALLENLILPLVSPMAMSGLVIVLVVFMLLEREHLRDRFIRLVGAADLHCTTQVLEEAGGRVANYLLMQLVVNAIYALPIALGLWLIGVPNATLWGILTLVLRFVPYIGSVLAAAFPLFLAFAVSPDWAALFWTAALFLVVEAITSNAVEPWLYGAKTGVSSLAIIIAAIFWTFLWGPLGLVLSTPLTVCLVVLGRHIPQFEIFDILFGDEAVLAHHQRLYQRLLAGDAVEAMARASEALEEMSADAFYQTAALPALLLAQDDRDRGLLSDGQARRLADAAMTMVAEVAHLSVEDLEPGAPADPRRIACVGGRWEIDDVSAAMLAQSLSLEGSVAQAFSSADLMPGRIANLALDRTDCLILCFLDPAPSRASLLHIRRLKRLRPDLRVGVAIWSMPAGLEADPSRARRTGIVDPAKLAEAQAIGADFAVTTLIDAIEAGLADLPGIPLPKATATRPRTRRAIKPNAA